MFYYLFNFKFVFEYFKIDLERSVTIEQAQDWCKENGELPYVETSAKDATNVEEAFMLCLRRWASNDNKQVSFIRCFDIIKIQMLCY